MARVLRASVVAMAAVIAVGTLVPGAASAASGELDVESLIPAVVHISAVDDEGTELWTGSGTIIDPDGLVLTNAHVADDTRQPDGSIRATLLGIQTTHRPERPPTLAYRAIVAAIDYPRDLAVLRITQDAAGNEIEPRSLPYLRLGGDTVLGETITILGYPGIGGDTVSLTRGEISGYTGDPEYGDRSWIKTSATIAGGNSGGAAVNDRGELIGIPTRVGTGGSDRYVDCRPLADTNGDGRIDDTDTCVPVGGFFNELRPISMARPLVDAVRAGRTYRVDEPGDPPDEDPTPTPGTAVDQAALSALLERIDERALTGCEVATQAPYRGASASVRCEPADASTGVSTVYLDSFPDEATMVATFDRLASRSTSEPCAPGTSTVESWEHPAGRAEAARYFCYPDGDSEVLIWSEPSPGLVIGTAFGDDAAAVLAWWEGRRPTVATDGGSSAPSPSIPPVDQEALRDLIGRIDGAVVTGCEASSVAPYSGALVSIRCETTSEAGPDSVYIDSFPDLLTLVGVFDALASSLSPSPCRQGAPEVATYDHPGGSDVARYFCYRPADDLEGLVWMEPAPGLVIATAYGEDITELVDWWDERPLVRRSQAASPSPRPSAPMARAALADLLGRVDGTRVADCRAASDPPYRNGLASARCVPATTGTGVTDVYLDVFPDAATMSATFDDLVTTFGGESCTSGEPGADGYDHPSGDAEHSRSFCYERETSAYLIWSEPGPALVIGTALGEDVAHLLEWWQEQPVAMGEVASASPRPSAPMDPAALADLLGRVDDRVVTDCEAATAAPYGGALASVRCEPVGSGTGVSSVYLDVFPDDATLASEFQRLIGGSSQIVTCRPDQEPFGRYPYPAGDADAARFFCTPGEGDRPDMLLWSEPGPGLVIGTALGEEHALLFDWWEANRPVMTIDTAVASPSPTSGNDEAALADLIERAGDGVVTNCEAAAERYDGALAAVRCQRAAGTGVSSVFLDAFPDEATMTTTFEGLVEDLRAVPCVAGEDDVISYAHLSGDREAARYFCYHGSQREGLVWMEPSPGLVIGTAFGDDLETIREWWSRQPAIGIGEVPTRLVRLLSPDWIDLRTCAGIAPADEGATSINQIGCVPRPGDGIAPASYELYRFASAQDLRQAWETIARSDAGDCAKDEPGTSGWTLDGEHAGDISCGNARIDGTTVPELAWTEDSERLIGVIRFGSARDGDLSDLHAWWLASPALSS